MRSNRLSDLEREKSLISQTNRPVSAISVAIVSYNSRVLLRDCLVSIEAEPWEQVIVVDNASSDGSAEMVRQEFPQVKLILSPGNDGYGAAANMAIASCSTSHVLLLNSDTRLHPGALHTLSEYLAQHSEVGIAGPQLVNSDGSPQISCFEFPTPLETLRRETSLSRFVPHASKFTAAESQAVPWVLGAALAIRRMAFEAVGGFDESFFMYFEEVDLCYRLRQAGWQTQFVPAALVEHVGGASTKRHRAGMLQQLYQSLCLFYQRHYSGWQKKQLGLILTYLMFRNIVKDKIRSYRPGPKDEALDNLSVWRSILTNVWSNDGWLRD